MHLDIWLPHRFLPDALCKSETKSGRDAAAATAAAAALAIAVISSN